MLSRLATYLLLLLTAAGLQGCRHKGLLYDDEAFRGRVRVVFDWTAAPDATPSSMALYLYPRDGGAPLRYIFDNRDGGVITVPYDTYDAICMNADNTDWALSRGTDVKESFEIHTPEQTSLSQLVGEDERLTATPGMLWTGYDTSFKVYASKDEIVITLHPEEAVCHYVIDILDVENIEALASTTIIATFSGMAESHFPQAKATSTSPVSHPITFTANTADASLHSEFLCFGLTPGAGESNMLHLHTFDSSSTTPDVNTDSRADSDSDTDSSHRLYEFDCTSQTHSAADPRHVHIVLSGLTLPKTVPTGPSLRPTVEAWLEEHITLPM